MRGLVARNGTLTLAIRLTTILARNPSPYPETHPDQEPLSWDNLRPFMLQFDQFDVSKTGVLSKEDLEKYCTSVASTEANKAALSPTRGKRQWMTGNGLKRAITGRKTKSGPLGQLEA